MVLVFGSSFCLREEVGYFVGLEGPPNTFLRSCDNYRARPCRMSQTRPPKDAQGNGHDIKKTELTWTVCYVPVWALEAHSGLGT